MIEVPITLPIDARAGSGNWFKPVRIVVRDSNGGGVSIEVESKVSGSKGTLPPIMLALTREDAKELIQALRQQIGI